MGKKGAVFSKQQLSDELLNAFLACEVSPEVEKTDWSETDVDPNLKVLFCLMEHDAEEHGEQGGG